MSSKHEDSEPQQFERIDSIFSKWCWGNWVYMCRRMKLDLYISCCTKIRSKQIKKTLHLKPKTLEENRLHPTHIGVGKDFMNKTPFAQELRPPIDKWNFMKLSSFCTVKETTNLVKRKPTGWKEIFASYTCDSGLVSRIYKELRYQ